MLCVARCALMLLPVAAGERDVPPRDRRAGWQPGVLSGAAGCCRTPPSICLRLCAVADGQEQARNSISIKSRAIYKSLDKLKENALLYHWSKAFDNFDTPKSGV